MLKTVGVDTYAEVWTGHVHWEGRVTLKQAAQRGCGTSSPEGVSRFSCSAADLIHCWSQPHFKQDVDLDDLLDSRSN